MARVELIEAAAKMVEQLNLPSCVTVGKDSDSYVGLFAKESIERGTKLFSREIYSFGVGGITRNDLTVLCHHCLTSVEISPPVLCKQCMTISYCSRDCLKAAQPLHALECKGVKKLEKLRGKVIIKIPRPSSWLEGYEYFWPPPHAMLAARVINKGIVSSGKDHDTSADWIQNVRIPDTLPPVKVGVFAQLEKYVRLLVPDDVSDEKIRQAFLAISINTSNVSACPPRTSILAAYNLEYLMLNHICKPNCEVAQEEDDNVAIYTIEDVAEGEQLGISFVTREYYMNVRELRCPKLMECFGLDCHCFICKGEMVPNSKLWTLEKQKSSLITPWSLLTARKTMVDGWAAICESNSVPSKSSLEIVELLEPALEVQKRILDKCNIMRILTATTLILKYCKLNERQMSVNVFYDVLGPAGMASVMEYGTRMDVVDLTGNICISLLDLGRVEEFNKMFSLTQQVHPRQPSCETLCEMLHLDFPVDQSDLDEEDIQSEIQIRANRLGIPSSFYSAMVREVFDVLDGPPSLPELMQACQHMMGNGHDID